jgi:hypothetical protein
MLYLQYSVTAPLLSRRACKEPDGATLHSFVKVPVDISLMILPGVVVAILISRLSLVAR